MEGWTSGDSDGVGGPKHWLPTEWKCAPAGKVRTGEQGCWGSGKVLQGEKSKMGYVWP